MAAFVAPPTGAPNGRAIIYAHGSGEDGEAFWTETDKGDIEAAVDAAGFYVAGIECGENWGNQDAIDNYVALHDFLLATFQPIRGVGFLAQSMGGLASLNVLAAGSTSITSWAGIFPACNLAAIYAIGTYDDAIRTAYGIAGDGSDYASKTAGFDPVLGAGADYRGIAMRFYASPDDTVVPKVSNSDAMIALVAGNASEDDLLVCTGEHGDASHFQPSNLVAFFNRTIPVIATANRSAHLNVGTNAETVALSIPGRSLVVENHDADNTVYFTVGGVPGGPWSPTPAVVSADETYAVPPGGRARLTVAGGAVSLVSTGALTPVSVYGI